MGRSKGDTFKIFKGMINLFKEDFVKAFVERQKARKKKLAVDIGAYNTARKMRIIKAVRRKSQVY